LQRLCGNDIESAFEDEKIEILMPQGECQMIREILSRPIPLIEDSPYAISPLAAAYVFLGDTTWPANRGLNGQRLNQRSPAHKLRLLRNMGFLEGRDRSQIKAHASKTSSLQSKTWLFLAIPSKTT
jgi:hypothetical protein